ncbi:hypothetical protein X946_5538 [Burkholderia sp. ABCPW 111]|nr:hypothetical protein X946_5538 [Burkholderia sp. ABCPW 111]
MCTGFRRFGESASLTDEERADASAREPIVERLRDPALIDGRSVGPFRERPVVVHAWSSPLKHRT